MEQQHNVLVVDAQSVTHSIIAVVPGAGFERIVRELGAEVVVGGEKNPSVRDLLLAVNKTLSNTVYLFVNDKNVALAAAEVRKLTDKDVRIVGTSDIVAGIAGLFAFRGADGEAVLPDAQSVLQAAQRVRSAQVFLAGKDSSVDGVSVSRGKPAAAVDGKLVTASTIGETVVAAASAMGAQNGGLITLYYGGAQKEKDAQRVSEELAAAMPDAEVEYYYGGMKNAEYWVSLDE